MKFFHPGSFFVVITAGFWAGCGYYPQHVSSADDLWAPWDRYESGIVVNDSAHDVTDRLVGLGWKGGGLEFGPLSGVDDTVLMSLRDARNSGRIKLSGLGIRSASRCSSRELCHVIEWPGLAFLSLDGSCWDGDAEPQFSSSLSCLNIEGSAPLPSGFFRHFSNSNIQSLSIPASASDLKSGRFFRLKNQAGSPQICFHPIDGEARKKLEEVIVSLRRSGADVRRFSRCDENRCVSGF